MCSLDGSLAVALACSLSLIGSFSRSWVCSLVPCFATVPLLCYGAFALPRSRTCVFPRSLVGSFSRSLVCSSRSCVSQSHLRVLSQFGSFAFLSRSSVAVRSRTCMFSRSLVPLLCLLCFTTLGEGDKKNFLSPLRRTKIAYKCPRMDFWQFS